MYSVAKLVNWILVAVAAALFIILSNVTESWHFIVIGLVLAAATPIDFILAKKILEDKSVSVKANVRQFAKRFMENAIYWSVIGLTAISHGIIRTVYEIMEKTVEGWIAFIPVFVFIIGWSIAGKLRFDSSKYDEAVTK